MLGLAVDYSVLQLRRTREERQKGKSTEESVGYLNQMGRTSRPNRRSNRHRCLHRHGSR